MSKETPIHNLPEKYEMLFTCLREVFPALKNYSDETLEHKLGEKQVPFIADEFNSYLVRKQPVGAVIQRNAKLTEGCKILNVVQQQLINYHYPQVAVTVENVVKNFSLVDDYELRKEEERVAWLKKSFPGYWKLMDKRYPEVPAEYVADFRRDRYKNELEYA
jgi:hypothetical protein